MEQKVIFKLDDINRMAQILNTIPFTGTNSAYGVVEIMNILQSGTLEQQSQSVTEINDEKD